MKIYEKESMEKKPEGGKLNNVGNMHWVACK